MTGIPESDRENGTKLENTLQDIIQENFPNLARQVQIQEIKREDKISEKRIKRNEQSLQEIWDYVKRSNLFDWCT